MTNLILISSFVLGFAGSLHCLGMCGPLALSVPFAKNGSIKWQRITTFYFSKAVAYGFSGIFFGLFGKVFILMNWQQALSITAGLTILLMISLPALKPTAAGFLFQKQFNILYSRLQQRSRLSDYMLLGFLNGLLPCGLVYTALAAATLSGGWAQGFAAMFLFGLGTAPALIMLVVLRYKINRQWSKHLKPVSVGLSVCIGVLLILRGLNLGIPYVSPEFKNNSIHKCCSNSTHVQ